MYYDKEMTVESGSALGSVTPTDNFGATKDQNSGAKLGDFPSRLNSVSAEVLARLLRGERLTSIDAVDSSSTTRLAARVHYLKEIGWPIEKLWIATGCRDGRLAWVAEYYMPDATIAAAMLVGGGRWCENVKAARRELGIRAVNAKRDARRINAARRTAGPIHQLNLFGRGDE